MKTFVVTWEIEIDAETPREAAEKARQMQLDPANIATCFDVIQLDTEDEPCGEMLHIDLLDKEDSDGTA